MTPCPERAFVDRHFEGTISPPDEREMRAHLPTCASCRTFYDRRLLLSRLDPQGLSAEARIARGLGLERAAQPPSIARPLGIAAFATLVAVAAGALLWVRSVPEPGGFASRGGNLQTSVSRVFVYDVHPGKPAALAGDTVARGDELAFAYENGAAKNRLMIFGVDEHRHVYWFYPAWENPSENPVAIAIEHDAVRHELPEAVRHGFDGAQLEIRSLFVDAPVTVSQVEAMLREDPNGPLPIPGAIETPAFFTVAP